MAGYMLHDSQQNKNVTTIRNRQHNIVAFVDNLSLLCLSIYQPVVIKAAVNVKAADIAGIPIVFLFAVGQKSVDWCIQGQ